MGKQACKVEQKILFINLKEVSTKTRSSLKTTIQTTAKEDIAAIPALPPATKVNPFVALFLPKSSNNNKTRTYDLDVVEEAVFAALEQSTHSHVLAEVKLLGNVGSVQVLIELTLASQSAATTTTSDAIPDPLNWYSDFATSYAQALYEKGCELKVFDAVNFEAQCDIELNSEVAQMKMCMLQKRWSAWFVACYLGYVNIVQTLLSDDRVDVTEGYEVTCL